MANTGVTLDTTAGAGDTTISSFAIGDTVTFDAENQGASWNIIQSDSVHTSNLGTYTTTGTGQPNQLRVVGSTGGAVPNGGTGAYTAQTTTLQVFKNPQSTNDLWCTVTIPNTATTPSATISFSSTANLTAGQTVTVNYDGNLGNASYNSTGAAGSTQRFSPKNGSRTLAADGDGSFIATAQTVTSPDDDGAWEGLYSIRSGTSGGAGSTTLDTTSNITIYIPVVAPTPSISITSDNQDDGSFVFTCGESGGTTWPNSQTQYRFLNASGGIERVFDPDNTYSGTGNQRPFTLKAQIQEVGTYNTASSSQTTTLTVNEIAADTNFTASSPTIFWDASSFTITLTGVQVGDEVRAVLTSNTSVIFENYTPVTSTTFNLVCNNATINSTNLPNGQATSVRIQVRRPESTGGNGNSLFGTDTTVTRNYRTGPFASVVVTTPTGASATIGAQKYNAYDIGQSEQVRVTGSGVISGATYVGRIISGTTQGGATSGSVYSQVASGTEPNAETTAGGCSFSQLPTPGNTCGYRITCIIPTNLGGDGTTEHECCKLTIYTPGNETEWTITRSFYVDPDGTITKSSSATLVSASDYRIGASSTSETVSYTNGGSTTEYRLQKLIGTSPTGGVVGSVSSGASGIFTVGNSDLPPNAGDQQGYTIEFRVPETNDGTGQWFSNIGANSLLFQREELIQPTLGTLQAYANSSNLAQVVPTVERTNNSGNGLIEYAWSSTNSAPTNWTSLGALGFVAGFDIAAGGIARSANNLYMGVREKSPIDGTATTATYVSNTNGPYYNEVETLNARITEVVYDGGLYYPSDGDQVIIEATELSNDVTLRGGLSTSLAKESYTETQVAPNTAGFSITSSVTNYSSFSLRTNAAATLNGVARSANFLVGSDTTNSSGNSVFNIDNPTEIVDAGNTLGYTLYEYVFTERGGDGIEVATTPAADNSLSIRRRGVIDGAITVTVPKNTLAPADGSQTITIADGTSDTQYRIRVTGSTDPNSDSSPPLTGTNIGPITGNGTIVLSSANLPEEGDTVSYKVQFREAGTSDVYADCTGTNSTFTIGRIENFTITDGAPNTNRQVNTDYDSTSITVQGISGTETVTVRQNSNNAQVAWAQSSVNGGAFSNSDKSITDGQSLVIRFTTSSADNTSRTIRVTFTGSGHEELWTLTSGASTGTGAGGGGQTGTGDYGLQINNSSGNTLINQNSRVTRSVADGGPVDINGGGTTSSAISVTGLTNTDEWTIIVTATNPTQSYQTTKFSVNKGTGAFTITNNTEDDGSGDPNNDRRRFYWRVFKSA